MWPRVAEHNLCMNSHFTDSLMHSRWIEWSGPLLSEHMEKGISLKTMAHTMSGVAGVSQQRHVRVVISQLCYYTKLLLMHLLLLFTPIHSMHSGGS